MGLNTTVSDSPNGIFDIISGIDRGELVFDLEDAFKAVVDAAREQQSSGEVTIKFRVKYDKSTDAMLIGGKVSKKLPEKRSKDSIFFFNPEGNLTRLSYDRQNQQDMFISKGD